MITQTEKAMKTKRNNYKVSNVKDIVREYIADRNLTKLCRNMYHAGIRKRSDIHQAFYDSFSKRYLNQKKINVASVCYQQISHDLDKPSDVQYNQQGYTKWNMIRMIKFYHDCTYPKILIEGNRHIYWADPIYKHKDYNKSIWRENTPANREKMNIINSFIAKLP